MLLVSLPLCAVAVVVVAVAPESRASEILTRSLFERESRAAWEAAAAAAAAGDEKKEGEGGGEERSAARPTTQATAAAPPSEASGLSAGARRPARADAQRGVRSTSEEE